MAPSEEAKTIVFSSPDMGRAPPRIVPTA